MSILDFFKRKKEPVAKKVPQTLDEVPYPGLHYYTSLRNTEMTKEILDILPELMEIEGIGEILRSKESVDKNHSHLWSIFHGTLSAREEVNLDPPVQKFLEAEKRHPVLQKSDARDRTAANHLFGVMVNLMWLPPERRLPMLNKIKEGVANLDERAEFLESDNVFNEELHDYWKKEGYTVEEAMNYNPDKPIRHNMNGLMKQLGGVGNKFATEPTKGQGKKLYNSAQSHGDSGLQI